jgi:hypothetical protein
MKEKIEKIADDLATRLCQNIYTKSQLREHLILYAGDVEKIISSNLTVTKTVCDNCGKKEPMICQDCYAAEVFRTDE